MTVKQYNDNVRTVRYGAGISAFEELQYRDGDAWVVSATFYEDDDFMYSRKSRALDALLARYPNAPKPCVFVATVRPTAFRKDRDERHVFDSEEEAREFVRVNRDFCFSRVAV